MNLDRPMVQGQGRRFQLIKSVLVTVGITGSQMQSAHGAMATTRSGLADLRAQGALSVSRSGISPRSACKSGASGRQKKGRVQNLAVDDQTPDGSWVFLGSLLRTAAERVRATS